MAHEVESMFYLGQTPWHGLGKKIERVLTVEEAIREAGLDWEVALQPIYTAPGPNMELVEDAQLCYRLDNGKQLGTVGKRYRPLQNAEAFKVFQPLVESNEIALETAGSLNEGRKIWILGRINKDPLTIVGKADDVVERFVLLSNSHDGTLAVRMGFTPIRVVCNNTLTFAITSDDSKLIRVRHTTNMVKTLDELRETMNVANAEFEATAEQYRLLATRDINSKDLDKYFRIVFDKAEDQVFRKEGKIIELFENGRGNDLPGVRGTYWAAYNAVTEYLSYEQGRSQEKRLDNLWFGTSVNINQKALDTALQMAA